MAAEPLPLVDQRLPWRLQVCAENDVLYIVREGDDICDWMPIYGGDEAHETGAFICLAVNSHAPLVAALTMAEEILGRNGIERPEIAAALRQAEGREGA